MIVLWILGNVDSRAAEQLLGIEQDPSKFTPSHTRFQTASSSIHRRFRTHELTSTPSPGVSYASTPVPDDDDDVVDSDFYLLAKSYFDCKEYKRAAHVLRDQSGRKAVFLRCYASYMVCHALCFISLCFKLKKVEPLMSIILIVSISTLLLVLMLITYRIYRFSYIIWVQLDG